MVRRHWEEFRPRELATIRDPEAFFARKGREIQAAAIDAQEALEAALPPEPDYQARVGQLNQIRATAEQRAMAELLPPPEEDEEPPTPASPPGQTDR
jgi:hypothetical protein